MPILELGLQLLRWDINGVASLRPLILAIQQNNQKFVQVLLERYAAATTKRSSTNSFATASTSDIVPLALNLPDDKGILPLTYAVQTMQPQLVRLLMEHGMFLWGWGWGGVGWGGVGVIVVRSFIVSSSYYYYLLPPPPPPPSPPTMADVDTTAFHMQAWKQALLHQDLTIISLFTDRWKHQHQHQHQHQQQQQQQQQLYREWLADALITAVTLEQRELAVHLLEQGANVHASHGQCLRIAASTGNAAMTAILLRAGAYHPVVASASASATAASATTASAHSRDVPLVLAVAGHHSAVVRLLLEAGANWAAVAPTAHALGFDTSTLWASPPCGGATAGGTGGGADIAPHGTAARATTTATTGNTHTHMSSSSSMATATTANNHQHLYQQDQHDQHHHKSKDPTTPMTTTVGGLWRQTDANGSPFSSSGRPLSCGDGGGDGGQQQQQVQRHHPHPHLHQQYHSMAPPPARPPVVAFQPATAAAASFHQRYVQPTATTTFPFPPAVAPSLGSLGLGTLPLGILPHGSFALGTLAHAPLAVPTVLAPVASAPAPPLAVPPPSTDVHHFSSMFDDDNVATAMDMMDTDPRRRAPPPALATQLQHHHHQRRRRRRSSVADHSGDGVGSGGGGVVDDDTIGPTATPAHHHAHQDTPPQHSQTLPQLVGSHVHHHPLQPHDHDDDHPERDLMSEEELDRFLDSMIQ